MGRVSTQNNRTAPALGFGLPRVNELDHSKRPLSDAPGLHEPGTIAASARVKADLPDAGKSVTGVAATDIFTSAAHGYSAGDRVKFSTLTGGAGITAGTTYYVKSPATNTFQVSATPGGAALNFTTDLTVGTVTRSRYRYVGSSSHKGPQATLPPTPGPRSY